MEYLDTFSRIVTTLHRDGPRQPLERFQDWAFDAVKPLVPFDTGFWGGGSAAAGAVAVIHNVHLHGLPAEMTADWERVKHTPQDRAFVDEVVAAGGQSVLWDDRILGKHPLYPKYDVLQIVTSYLFDPASGIFDVVSFYRGAASPRFSEAERRLHQALVPHLLDVERKVRLRHLESRCGCDMGESNSQAACDAEGVLRLAQPGFVRALLAEWPDWRGPALPAPLTARLKLRKEAEVTGAQFVITVAWQHDMFLLKAQPRGPIDDLSAREKLVARQWLSGASYKSIAARMSISPKTVRNHLSKIYEKLGVTSRDELAAALGGNRLDSR